MIRVNRNPERRQLRLFAGLVFPLFCAWIAWLVHWRTGLDGLTLGLVGLGLVVAVAGNLWLPIARAAWLGTMYAVFPIGFVISHILLAIVYYLVITPIGLALRLAGKDPMTRRFDPQAPSYWVSKEPQIDTERYFRQY
jgi:ABC-type uncharacterized transport system permease subunit